MKRRHRLGWPLLLTVAILLVGSLSLPPHGRPAWLRFSSLPGLPAAGPGTGAGAGVEALFGPDRDGDLVRDDVSDAIHRNHAGVTHAALMQVARNWQKLALSRDARPEIQYQAGNGLARALTCALSPGVLARANIGPEEMYHHIDAVRRQLFNTPARQHALEKAEAGRQGQPWRTTGAPCDFDPALLSG